MNFRILILFVFIGFALLSCTMKNSEVKENKTVKIFSLEQDLLANGYEKIALDKLRSGHLHFKLKLNGVIGSFILDTGAGATVVEENRRDKFKMKVKKSDEIATGAGGTDIQTHESNNNLIAINSLILKNYKLVLMSLDYVNQALVSMDIEEVDGIVGADILEDKEAIIDYSNLILYLKK